MFSLRNRVRATVLAGLSVAAVTLTTLPATTTTAVGEGDPFRAQMVLVDTPTPSDKRRLTTLGLDLTEHVGRDYVEVVLHTPDELAALTGSGFTYNVSIPDLQRREGENNAINDAYAANVAKSELPSRRTSYRTMEDYNAEMEALEAKYPKLVDRFELPYKTLNGEPVFGIEVAKGVKRVDDGRPTFLLMGVHHAREWPSGELAMEFAVDMAKKYGKSKTATRLLTKGRLAVIPVVNVDGFKLSRRDGGLVDLRDLNDTDLDPLGGSTAILGTPGQAYKRKNCRVVDGQDTPDGSCDLTLNSNGGFGAGVDLNRNYGGFWGGPGAAGPTPEAGEVSTGTLDPTYRGAAPFSEPETQNVREFVSSRQVTMLISNHTFSNLILRPNGVNPDTIGADGLPVGDSPDEKALKKVGAKMAANNGYQNIHGWQLYDTTGTTEDWSYNATGGFGYTFEIGPDEFHPPFPDVVDEYIGTGDYAGKGNRKAYIEAFKAAVNPETHSVITGKAPKGAVLRLSKTFQTPTWESSFEDSLESTLVAKKGAFSWHINKSTRPVLAKRKIDITEDQVVESKTYTGGRTSPTDEVDYDFTLDREADRLLIDLDWANPDDLDLEVFRRINGELVSEGTSGNSPGDKEQVILLDPAQGEYVLRVINYAAVTPDYTLRADVIEQKVVDTKVIGGKVERWTLTCETKRGKVLSTSKVLIDRGQTKTVDLKTCRKKF